MRDLRADEGVAVNLATGLGTAIFDGATSSMSITINVQGLDWGPLAGQASQSASLLDNVTGADIRNAPRGENGPIRPMRVHGRLAWPVADLRRVLGVQEQA